MPKIYDNISLHLKTGLLSTLESSHRADFCVGYFNLRGWKILMDYIDHFEGNDNCCRLLVGMQSPEENLLRKALSEFKKGMMDNPTAAALKKEIAKSFVRQLTFGIPTVEDEKCLRKLKVQLVEKKVKVKLFLDYPLPSKKLKSLSINLMDDFVKNAIFQLRNDKRAGTLEIQSYQPRQSKPIIDEIDKVLAEHYGFTEGELDFIINYDIKYRMGKELEGGEEE